MSAKSIKTARETVEATRDPIETTDEAVTATLRRLRTRAIGRDRDVARPVSRFILRLTGTEAAPRISSGLTGAPWA
jgi:hypothetical protein